MKILKAFALIAILIMPTLASAEPRRCTNNDTVVRLNEDQLDLMKYLKGQWSVTGSWQVTEGEGKIRKNIKARFTGSETYTPILNGHFLQKQRTGQVKYDSRDLGKKVQNSFSSTSIMTFNNNLNKFFLWYYDCSGAFMESDGRFNHEDNKYIFDSKIVNESNREQEAQYVMTIVDDNHYRWEIKHRTDAASKWEVASTGLATRRR